ncbi:MAG: hypothetical protein ABSA02_07200 [Trebonia sp.]
MASLMRTVPASVLAAAIALSAAACSSSGSSGSGTSSAVSLSGTPDQIVQKAVNDLKAATSLQISGNVVSGGSNIKVDLTDVANQGCKGTITLGAGNSSGGTAVSGTAELIEVSSTVYMKLDESFFKNLSLPSSVFSQVSGKYIEVTSKSDLANFAQLCDPSTLASGFDKEVTGFVKNGTATINGQPTEAFKQPTHAGSGIVYISQSSTPEIVRLQGPANEGQINFTNYNAPATITAPPASEVIQGSKFGL